MIKYLFVICFLFLLHNDEAELLWSESYKLTWQDFKGQPNLNTDAVAVTASGITFSYSIKKTTSAVISFKTIVKASFYPEHSWCKKSMVDSHVLSHEQLHFDITELHARYFREQISNLKASNNVAEILQAYHQNTNAKLEKMQQEYDEESNYSINKEGQLKWQNFIEKELKRLSNYKSKS